MSAGNRTLEIGTGLFVLLGFTALAFLTTQLPGSGVRIGSVSGDGYAVSARFDNVGDLKVGAPVTMAGVRIGRVDSVGVDATDFRAIVKLSIERRFDHIPTDSDAAIQTSGLLGAKYIGLSAGGADTFLKEGASIEFTQSALVLENLVNKLFSSIAGKGGDSRSSAGSNSEEKK
jgi:phospholipid/cholesterol/gamma-HCH transport system substrate-binding protein